ncbi:DUF1428 domain-containing protein [Alteriqipengyuania lutimaris]|uniref:DUF1428 domain-containing protein n=1 Tax=Alteriqipengyuania lutimaris TaxID=1538146 RepID=A0A395LLZ3_9SPHN|nr:DUF1428 domain-containing protein [Alteriqipengyuania lutimaris]MBB3033223.1 uncharacterized protein YbaA (DUF1428 family) [Alteriqipengyuania lutimaris]RDS77729.1 DUF1428 domain-containing protein [Alteriqipengyuania lutimaris]
MYVNGFVLAVPKGNKQAYIDVAKKFWPLAREFGALSQIECWEADVQDGHTTDFRRATKAEVGEKIVFSWVTWPDQATAKAAEKKMMEDPRMAEFGEMPFDGKRMIFGGFDPILEEHA